MKKYLFIFLLICTGCVFFYINERSFTPLKDEDFGMIFPNYRGKITKICDIDYLGINLKGETFDFYLYKAENISLNPDYPKLNNRWERRKLNDTVLVSKWKNCPVDSAALELYGFLLTANDFNDKTCSCSFNKELDNPQNYYSYIYFNELESYFLLYCVDKKHLYYIRHKGF